MSTTLEPGRKNRKPRQQRSGKRQRSYAEFGEYIDHQLQKTRNGIRWNDIFTALCGTGVLVIGYLLAFVVLDHWAVRGGFGPVARVSALSSLLALTAVWLGWKVILPWLRRINELYAARAIENVSPKFKSNLLNYVDLKEAGRDVSTPVLNTIEKRAAVSLSHSEVEEAVDRRMLLRLCYVLFAVVTAFCAYAVFSPKKVGPSIWRAFAPASTLSVATETEIVDVKYQKSILAREHLEVVVNLKGRKPDNVTLLYTTSDRSAVDEKFDMRTSSEGVKQFRTRLTGEDGAGLLQDFEFRIIAGDDQAGPFPVDVQQPPSATIGSIQYEYPDYTEYPSQSQDGGHVEALEGTRITISATTNMPVKRATIQWSETEVFPNRPEEDAMQIDGLQLSYVWQPRLRKDGSDPKFYRIACKTEDGIEDPSPAVHGINVIPDQPPEVALVNPTGDIKAAANAIIPLLVRARDPDFRLNQMRLHIKRETETLPHIDLYEGDDPEKEILFDLKLAPYHLHPGDELTCWVEVRDNRFVEGRDSRGPWELPNNRTDSPRFKITIEEKLPEEEVAEQHKRDREHAEQKLEESPTDQNNAGGGAQEDPELKQNEGTDDQERRDPETKDPDDNKEQGENSKDSDKGDEKPSGENQDGSDRKASGEQSGEPQSGDSEGESASGEKGTAADKTGEEGSRETGTDGDDTAKSGKGTEEGRDSEKTGTESPDDTGQQDSLRNDGGDDAEALRQILERARERQREKQDSTSDSANEGNATDDAPDKESTGEQPPEDAADGTSSPSDPDATKPDDGTTPEKNPDGSKAAEPNADNDPENGSSPDSRNAASKDQPRGESTEQKDQAGDDTRPGQKPEENPDAANDSDSKGTGENSKESDTKGANDGGTGTEKTDPKGSPSGEGSEKTGNDPGKQSDPNKDKPATDGMPKENGMPGDDSKSSGSDNSNPNSKPGDSPTGSPDSKDGSPGDPSGGDSKGGSDTRPNSDPKEGKKSSGSKPGDGKPSSKDQGKPGSDNKADGKDSDKGTGSADSRNASTKKADSDQSSNEKDGKKPSSQDSPPESGSDPKSSNQKSKDKGQSGKSNGQDGKESGEGGTDGGQDGSPKGTGKQEGGEAKPGKQGGTGSPSGGKTSEHSGPGEGGDRRRNPNGEQKFDADDVQQGDLSGGHGTTNTESTAEEASLADQKEATDLALRSLKDELERGDVDQELLDRLGWSDNDLKDFLKRMDRNLEASQSDAAGDRVRRRQFEEMLKSLDVNQGGGSRLDPVGTKRDANSFEQNRLPVPTEYRKAFESYTRRLSKQQRRSKSKAGK